MVVTGLSYGSKNDGFRPFQCGRNTETAFNPLQIPSFVKIVHFVALFVTESVSDGITGLNSKNRTPETI